jgi:Mnd1 HTH domain
MLVLLERLSHTRHRAEGLLPGDVYGNPLSQSCVFNDRATRQLKELEKLGPKMKGIGDCPFPRILSVSPYQGNLVTQSVKEVLQSLVDDDLVQTDKIGSSNCKVLSQPHVHLHFSDYGCIQRCYALAHMLQSSGASLPRGVRS